MRIRFGDYLLDEPNYVLERTGERVVLRPKVFDLLVFLVRHRRRVVRREELVEALWDTTVVGAGSLSGLVNELRQALGEDGRGASSVRTVHARGYQFVARVVEEDAMPPTASQQWWVEQPEAKGAALVTRVAEEGVAGVVIEVPSAQERDHSRDSARVRALLELAEQHGFECQRVRAPDRSQIASIGFARNLVRTLLAARGRSALRSALPLRARVWFEQSAVLEVAGGFSAPSPGPPDPIGTMSHLLADMARRKPLVLIIEGMDEAESGFAWDLIEVSKRLGAAPVLWAIPVAAPMLKTVWHPLLERHAAFELWRASESSVEELDLALRRVGVEPLPAALADALAAHVGPRRDGIECIAQWLGDRSESVRVEPDPVDDSAGAAGPAVGRVPESAPRRMRRVEPPDRGSESRRIRS